MMPRLVLGLSILLTVPLWSQTESTPAAQPVPPLVGVDNGAPSAAVNETDNDRMLTPPPVSGQTYPTVPTSEERSNYLRYGVSFTSAYTDNALGGVTGQPISDISYSIAPSLALDETTSRMHWVTTYAPGFTIYQRTSARNEADHNASIEFEYRLSPHITFGAQDGFQKSSNMFNHPTLGSVGTVSGGAQQPNFSVIAPIADRLSNSGNVSLTYQFALNGMVGANGIFANLHYPHPAQVPGLYDSSSQAGSAFYSLRVSKRHYLGVTYQYQRLVSFPIDGLSEAQTHAGLFFYTLYPTSRLSISLFGGPQHSDVVRPQPALLGQPLPEIREWNPAAGASLNWQGRLNSFALSYSHVVAGGGGLSGAVLMDAATASLRQQITRHLSGSIDAAYIRNDVLGGESLESSSGHTLWGTVSLQQQLGQHFGLQLGYTRLHQTYRNVEVIATAPDTNREFVSVSYQFSRPLGR